MAENLRDNPGGSEEWRANTSAFPLPEETAPERRQELLGLIGDPDQVGREMDAFREQAVGFDPMPDTTLILKKQ